MVERLKDDDTVVGQHAKDGKLAEKVALGADQSDGGRKPTHDRHHPQAGKEQDHRPRWIDPWVGDAKTDDVEMVAGPGPHPNRSVGAD